MFHSPKPLKVLPWACVIPNFSRFLPPAQPTARGQHAHMLEVAAARRMRAVERAQSSRQDDARYWKDVAPAAVARAARLRREAFAPLPA